MGWLVRDGRRGDALCLGGLFLVAAVFMWPAWQQPDGLWYAPGAPFSDLAVTHWPNMWFVAQTFRTQGQIPLWRPLIMGGAPFAGNPLAALFYPPNWLFLFLPITPTFHLLIGLHLFWGGAMLYGLVRWSYRSTAYPAFCAGLGYMLTPKLIAHLGAGHVGLSQAFAWLPLTVWLLRRAVARQSVRAAAWCGVTLALTLFADPRVAFYGALLLAAYALYRLIGAWRASGWRRALTLASRLLLVPLSSVLVGAVQILPTLELMGTTSRSALTLAEAGRDSLPWRYLAGTLLADRGGYHEWMTYLGLPLIGMALLALVRSTERERWFWAATAAVSLVFGLGTHAPLYPLLYHLMPGLGWLRVPPRALLLVALSANVLAALGVDALFGAAWSPRARRCVTRGALAGLLLFGGLGAGFALTLGDSLPPAVLGLAAAGGGLMAVLLLHAQPRIPRPVPQAVLAVLILLDLWSMGRSLLVLRPADEVFAEGAAPASFLSAQGRHFRVYSPSYSIGQQVGARDGIEQLDGVDPSQLCWVTAFLARAGGYEVGGYGVTIPYFPDGSDVHSVWRDASPDPALLGLLNGRYVAAEYPLDVPDLNLAVRTKDTYIYENERALPRAFTVAHTERVVGWEEAQDRLAHGFDPSRSALVEGDVILEGAPGWEAANVRYYSPNRILVEAEVRAPSLLVLSEVWYPGWQVTVDGVRQPYYRVDGIVRGVALDPGAHAIEWRYRPGTLRWGAALTLGALLAMVALHAASISARSRRLRQNRPTRRSQPGGEPLEDGRSG